MAISFSTPGMHTALKHYALIKQLALRDWLVFCAGDLPEHARITEDELITSWIRLERLALEATRSWPTAMEPSFFELGGES